MSKYTAERVRDWHRIKAELSEGSPEGIEHHAYADAIDALLREREAAKAVVTDEMVECACDRFMRVRGIGMHLAWQSMTEETRISYRNAMRAALEAAAPMLATPRSLTEALGVLEHWAMRGNILNGDDVNRFLAIADRIAPRADSESSEELKYWEQFGREIEKRLRYNQWSFKGSYPEIIDQIIKLASAQVPEGMVLVQSDNLQKIAANVGTSMDSSTTNSYRAAIYQQELYERQRLAKSMLATAPKPEKE